MKRVAMGGMSLVLALVLWIVVSPQFNRFPKVVINAVTNDAGLILYSVDPSETAEPAVGTPRFREYPIIGQTIVKRVEDRATVVDCMQKAARGAWDSAACFNPRHALRATNGAATYDVLLCFECGKAIIYFPDGHTDEMHIRGLPTELDAVLTAAHIPLAPH